MRRAQADLLEQPVRNNVLNPFMRTLASAQLFTTNLNPNPRPEPTSGIMAIRTNLCTNPRGVFTLSDYSGAANQTITANVAITDHPAGITTANRVSYASGASNPGVTLFLNPTPGTKYTISAWIYQETLPAGTTPAFAQAGVQQGTTTSTTTGVWTRASWTYTPASSGNQIGYRVGGTLAAAGSFLITGILVETAGIMSPFFDGAGAQRTNIATDPRPTVITAGTAGLIGWKGTRWFGQSVPTNGTHAIVSGVTDTPLPALTSYIRKTWASSPTTNGDTGFDHMGQPAAVTPGQVFTVTSWLRTSASGKNLQHSFYWYDANNAILSRATGQVVTGATPGQWVKLQSTITVPAGTVKWGVCSDVQGSTPVWAAGDTLDGTGLVIERADTASPEVFYEGTGDFTYAWNGTANASISYMRGLTPTGYISAFNNRAAAYASTVWAGSGTKSIRVTPLQPADGATTATYTEFTITGLNIGTTYYLTAKSYLPAPLTGTLDINFRRPLFPGTQPTNITLFNTPSNTAGVQESKMSFTAQATSHAIRLMNGASEGNGDMWWADISVADQQGSYFDGGTATDGDYTFYWAGAAHASVSRKSSTPPLGCNSTSTATTLRCTHAENNEKMARWSAPAWTLASSWRVALINPLNWQNIRNGGTYTMVTLYRFSGAWSSTTFALFLQDGGATNSVPSSWLSDVTTDMGNGWKLNRKVFKAGRDATSSTSFYSTLSTAALGAQDGHFDIKFAAIFDGNYQGDIFDGSARLSKWDGAADNSPSVGYPPTLWDIAGKPDLDLLGVSSGGVAVPVADPFGPRTIYLCYEINGNALNYPSFGSYGVAGSKGVTFQAGPIGSMNLFPRFDLPGGSLNVSVTLGNGRNNRRHVAAISLPQGLATAKSMLDGGAERTDTLNPGTTGWDDGRATAATASSDGKGVRMLVYYADHPFAVKQAISRYLGNKYGATVS